MLFALFGVQAVTLITLLVLLLRRPAAAAEAAADPRLAQLLAADLPSQLTRLDAQFAGLENHLRGELAQLRQDNSAASAALRGEVLANGGVLLVERVVRTDQGEHATGLQGINRLGEEIVVQRESLAAVVEFDIGEGDVPDHRINAAFG